jgi:hypothetical protein
VRESCEIYGTGSVSDLSIDHELMINAQVAYAPRTVDLAAFPHTQPQPDIKR